MDSLNIIALAEMDRVGRNVWNACIFFSYLIFFSYPNLFFCMWKEACAFWEVTGNNNITKYLMSYKLRYKIILHL